MSSAIKGGVVAAAVLAVGACLPGAAQAACTIDQGKSTATCSGDLSGGGFLINDITTTTVSDLTANIAPPSFTGGIDVLNGIPVQPWTTRRGRTARPAA